MKIVLEFPNGVQATVEKGIWTSDNADMAEALNAMTEESLKQLGYWPSLNWQLADPVIEKMNAKVVYADKIPYDPNVVY